MKITLVVLTLLLASSNASAGDRFSCEATCAKVSREFDFNGAAHLVIWAQAPIPTVYGETREEAYEALFPRCKKLGGDHIYYRDDFEPDIETVAGPPGISGPVPLRRPKAANSDDSCKLAGPERSRRKNDVTDDTSDVTLTTE